MELESQSMYSNAHIPEENAANAPVLKTVQTFIFSTYIHSTCIDVVTSNISLGFQLYSAEVICWYPKHDERLWLHMKKKSKADSNWKYYLGSCSNINT